MIISAAFKSKYGVNVSMSQRQGDFLHAPELYRRAGLKELRHMSRKDIKHRCFTVSASLLDKVGCTVMGYFQKC